MTSPWFADTRGAVTLDVSGATSANLILLDGHISGIELNVDSVLVMRDYDGDGYRWGRASIPPIPITVDQHLAVTPGRTLRMVFEAAPWDSTISFAPGIPVTLGGTPERTFADNLNPASQLGRTFDLFNWTGVNPTGAFAISSPTPGTSPTPTPPAN